MELFKLVGEVALNGTDHVKNELDDVSEKGEQSETRLTNAFKKIGTAVVTYFAVDKIIDFGKNIMATTTSFSDSMLKVQSLSGATGEQFEQLTESALDWGSKTAWTSSQVADAMGYMALAGFDTNEIMASLGGTLGLASASGTDLARASDILTDALTAFGYKAQDANLFADVLATTQAKSNTTVDMLGESFKYVGAVAGTYKYKVESVATALGLMANAGIKGSMSGTALSSIITRLATDTNSARQTIESLGVEFFNSDGSARDLSDVLKELTIATSGMSAEQKANIASVVAGAEAQKGLLAILNQGVGAYEELETALYNSAGSASSMSTTMESSIGGAIRTVQSAWEGFQIRLGQKFEPALTKILQDLATFVTETLVPAMEDLVGKISSFVGWLNSGSTSAETLKGIVEVLTVSFIALKAGMMIQSAVQGFQKAQIAISLLSMEVGSANLAQQALNGTMTIGETIVALLTGKMTLAQLATGLWTKAQTALNVALNANPIALIITAIVALIATVVVLWNKCEWFRDGIKAVFEWLLNAFGVVVEWLGNAIEDVKTFFVGLWETIQEVFTFIMNVISVAVQFIGALFGLLIDIILIPWNFIWQNFGDTIMEWINAVKQWIVDLWTTFSTWINGIWTMISEFFVGVWTTISTWLSGILTTIVNWAKGIATTITEWAMGIWTTITEWFNKTKEGLAGIVTGIKDFIAEKFNKVKENVSETFSKIKKAITEPIENAKKKVGEVVDNIKSMFKFNVSLPKIKLPHFAVTPKGWELGDLLKGKVPKLGIEWYAKAMDKGMILDEPTIFGINSNGIPMGAGEAGSETVVGTNSLMNMINKAVKGNTQQVDNSGIEKKLDKIMELMLKMKIELDDEVVGNFVVKTVEKEVFN